MSYGECSTSVTSSDYTDPLRCRIVSSEQVDNHTEYTLKVGRGYQGDSDARWTIRRRYRDFAKLNKSLQNLGLSFDLPPKKLFGNTKADFVVERTQGLQAFLDAVVVHPIVHSNRCVSDFLDSSTPASEGQAMSLSLRNLSEWTVKDAWTQCGWRPAKHFCLVRRSTEQRKGRHDLLTWTCCGPDAVLTGEAMRETVEFIGHLDCPFINRPLFNWSGDLGVVTVRRLYAEGSLRDHFYKSKPSDLYLKKYSLVAGEKFVLQLEDVRHIGRHILEALRYLNAVGVPYCQLHSGNLLITENGCQLLDVEEGVLGLPSFFRPLMVFSKIVKTVEDMEVFCFGQTVAEMVTGWSWFQVQSVEAVLGDCPPPFKSLIESIFVPAGDKMPSIRDLMQNELFADIAVPDYYKAEIRVPVKVQQYLADCRAQIESRLHRDQNSFRRSVLTHKARSFANSEEQKNRRKQLIREWSMEVRSRFLNGSNNLKQSPDAAQIAS